MLASVTPLLLKQIRGAHVSVKTDKVMNVVAAGFVLGSFLMMARHARPFGLFPGSHLCIHAITNTSRAHLVAL